MASRSSSNNNNSDDEAEEDESLGSDSEKNSEEEAEETSWREREAPQHRAFGALTLKEERHLVQAKSHLALAARTRWIHLKSRHPSGTQPVANLESRHPSATQTPGSLDSRDPSSTRTSRNPGSQDPSQTLEPRQPEEAVEAGNAYRALVQELVQSLTTEASDGVFADSEVMKPVLAIPEVRRDRAATLKLVKMHWRGLEAVSKKRQDDKEVVLAAVSSDARALLFASDDLKGDREVVFAALQQQAVAGITNYQHNALRWASPRLLGDKELVLAAVRVNPWALTFTNVSLQGDREVVLTAVKKQTAAHIDAYVQNILFFASEKFRSDREIVLEAVRSEAAGMELASRELRMDKDFLLQAARRVPAKDWRVIFKEAAKTVRQSVGWADFAGAAGSVLAVAGEVAPVLTVTLPAKLKNQLDKCSRGGLGSCEVSLLSGASFPCRLPEAFELDQGFEDQTPPPGPADEDEGLHLEGADGDNDSDDEENEDKHSVFDDDDDCYNSSGFDEDGEEEEEDGEEEEGEHSEEEEGQADEPRHEAEEVDATASKADHEQGPLNEPAAKRRRVTERSNQNPGGVGGGDEQGGSCRGPSVGQLAKAVLGELHKNVKMDPPPTTIFVVLAKRESEADSVSVTPWDWRRPLVDFL